MFTALSRHAKLLALIPVPLRDLVGCHINLRGDLHLRAVGPVGILVEVLGKNTHLVAILPHSPTRLPLVHVILLEDHACLCNVLLGRHGNTSLPKCVYCLQEVMLRDWVLHYISVFGLKIHGRVSVAATLVLSLLIAPASDRTHRGECLHLRRLL